MKHTKPFCIIALLFLSVSFVQAQTDSSAATKPKAQFKLSLNYNSGLNYYGRTDSLKSTGFYPLAELWFTPKFYINAAPVFVHNKLQSFDYAGTVATIGYQNVRKKWLTSFYVMKPFYKPSSELVQSALKGQSGLSLSYLNKIVNITAGADAKLSDKLDYGTTSGLDHIFKLSFKDNGLLIIDPSAYIYAGTQNFTNTYYQKKANFLPITGSTEQQVTENVQKFNILSYELSMPVIYVRGKWMILATSAYVLPQNLVTVPGRPDLSEKGKDLFYATIGLKRTF
jgi:hypothetical protein